MSTLVIGDPSTSSGSGKGGGTLETIYIAINTATSGGTSYTAGDTIANYTIVDSTGSSPVFTDYWVNKSTNTTFTSSPTLSDFLPFNSDMQKSVGMTTDSAITDSSLAGSLISFIKGISSLLGKGQKTSANSISIVRASDDNTAKETGGNLAAIATNTTGVAVKQYTPTGSSGQGSITTAATDQTALAANASRNFLQLSVPASSVASVTFNIAGLAVYDSTNVAYRGVTIPAGGTVIYDAIKGVTNTAIKAASPVAGALYDIVEG